MTANVDNMLRDINSSATSGLQSARDSVIKYSVQIHNVSQMLRDTVVTKLDDYQTKYIYSNATQGEKPVAEKYWSYAYMVSKGLDKPSAYSACSKDEAFSAMLL